ncbi:hypothetical protein [Providencia rettgeri]|uniref:phage tail fiber protein n=1 Tax=Providencia rettgeri TaxID=587 RepID=UPI0023AA7156|nr:hypothetical protein [Providencia rettgeri]
MYNIGTVTTTANSNKLVGTGTKWKENINGIQPQQVIQIVVGGIVYNSSIQSIESDTALTLNFPFHAAVKDAKYVILTTMVNSVSSAANYMVALNTSNMQARDVANAFMTLEGTVSMTAPDGTKVNLRTAKEMDKQLDGKFDKAGGDVNGAIKATGSIQTNQGEITAYKDGGSGVQISGSGNEAVIKSRNMGGAWQAHTIPNSPGTLMQVGDYGLGIGLYQTSDILNSTTLGCGFYAMPGGGDNPWGSNGSSHIFNVRHGNYGFQMGRTTGDTNLSFRLLQNGAFSKPSVLYSTENTTKDSNGNLKAASPIIRVFADHIDPNEEAEGVTLKKLHTGIYQLHGVLGLHSDASWGGINGGITIPCGINQLPLVYALYDVLEKGKPHPFDGRIVEPDEDGDIVLYTTYRKHDLPQNIQYERFKLYPEFLKEVDGEKVELTPGEPCDIPVGHWVDVRVNMPSNSIYNQKQAEAERLAKIEAERLAQEEAKRAAEEVERAE